MSQPEIKTDPSIQAVIEKLIFERIFISGEGPYKTGAQAFVSRNYQALNFLQRNGMSIEAIASAINNPDINDEVYCRGKFTLTYRKYPIKPNSLRRAYAREKQKREKAKSGCNRRVELDSMLIEFMHCLGSSGFKIHYQGNNIVNDMDLLNSMMGSSLDADCILVKEETSSLEEEKTNTDLEEPYTDTNDFIDDIPKLIDLINQAPMHLKIVVSSEKSDSDNSYPYLLIDARDGRKVATIPPDGFTAAVLDKAYRLVGQEHDLAFKCCSSERSTYVLNVKPNI